MTAEVNPPWPKKVTPMPAGDRELKQEQRLTRVETVVENVLPALDAKVGDLTGKVEDVSNYLYKHVGPEIATSAEHRRQQDKQFAQLMASQVKMSDAITVLATQTEAKNIVLTAVQTKLTELDQARIADLKEKAKEPNKLLEGAKSVLKSNGGTIAKGVGLGGIALLTWLGVDQHAWVAQAMTKLIGSAK